MISRKLLALAAGAFAATSAFAQITIATWTFETSPPADLTAATIGGISADVGTGTASGLHTSGSTAWTTPAGNGSANSLSANNWAVGNYYQFAVSTTGLSDISITWDQTGSNTGPRDFKISFSIDGSVFTDVLSYAITNDAWTSGSSTALSTRTTSLASFGSVNDTPSLFIRIVDTSTTAITGGTVATAGTGRVDNVTIAAAVAIPEPSTYAAILGAATLGIALWRRRARR